MTLGTLEKRETNHFASIDHLEDGAKSAFTMSDVEDSDVDSDHKEVDEKKLAAKKPSVGIELRLFQCNCRRRSCILLE
jgi:hypothetical protein